ncbi:MAG: HD domain-containing phosphohydrolase [Solirubrobacterales bacterium]
MDESGEIKILIIDDDRGFRQNMADFLEDLGYRVSQAENGSEGLTAVRAIEPDLVFCDIHMPDIEGPEVMSRLRLENPEIPLVGLSGSGDIADVIKAVRSGAWDYMTKPVREIATVDDLIRKAIERARMLRESRTYKEQLEREVRKRTQELAARADELVNLNARLTDEVAVRAAAEVRLLESFALQEKIFDGTIQAISRIVEVRDPYTSGHQARVAQMSREIAKVMELDQNSIKAVYVSGMLHDLGKIAIPSEILAKPGALSEQEFGFIMTHPNIGAGILDAIEFPWPIATIVLQHHERQDGSGYPNGLSRDDILVEARIIVVADVVEAMASHRPYRPALGLMAAMDEIDKNKGRLYDPQVVDACLELLGPGGFIFA